MYRFYYILFLWVSTLSFAALTGCSSSASQGDCNTLVLDEFNATSIYFDSLFNIKACGLGGMYIGMDTAELNSVISTSFREYKDEYGAQYFRTIDDLEYHVDIRYSEAYSVEGINAAFFIVDSEGSFDVEASKPLFHDVYAYLNAITSTEAEMESPAANEKYANWRLDNERIELRWQGGELYLFWFAEDKPNTQSTSYEQ